MQLPYTVTVRSISVFANGKMRVLSNTSPNFAAAAEALQKPEHNADEICELMNISTFIARKTEGAVQISDNMVRWNGEKVVNVVAERLIDALMAGHDTTPMARFLDRLMQNPGGTDVRDELFLWLESGNAPITPEGCFLAFKRVRANYMDCHSGTFDNSIGAVPTMKREDVETDRNVECSRGLHFCSHDYLDTMGIGSNYRTMVVKIDPADVVSIPRDYNNQKGRAWRYEVVDELLSETAAPTHFAGRYVVDQPSVVVGQDAYVEPYNHENEDHDPIVIAAPTTVSVVLPVEQREEPIVTTIKKTTKTGKLTFTYNAVTYTTAKLKSLLKAYGQRGAARETGVPRTTLQGWVKQIEAIA